VPASQKERNVASAIFRRGVLFGRHELRGRLCRGASNTRARGLIGAMAANAAARHHPAPRPRTLL